MECHWLPRTTHGAEGQTWSHVGPAVALLFTKPGPLERSRCSHSVTRWVSIWAQCFGNILSKSLQENKQITVGKKIRFLKKILLLLHKQFHSTPPIIGSITVLCCISVYNAIHYVEKTKLPCAHMYQNTDTTLPRKQQRSIFCLSAAKSIKAKVRFHLANWLKALREWSSLNTPNLMSTATYNRTKACCLFQLQMSKCLFWGLWSFPFQFAKIKGLSFISMCSLPTPDSESLQAASSALQPITHSWGH